MKYSMILTVAILQCVYFGSARLECSVPRYSCQYNNPCDPLCVADQYVYPGKSERVYVECVEGACAEHQCLRRTIWNQANQRCEGKGNGLEARCSFGKFDCEDRNPCTPTLCEDDVENYPGPSPRRYVSCTEGCVEAQCPRRKVWDQDQQRCVRKPIVCPEGQRYDEAASQCVYLFERIIQSRFNASVDFDKTWDEYVEGFGEEGGNFWLGLEEIHELTTTHDVSLDMNIETFVGDPFTLTLQTFTVGNAESNYTMHWSGFSQSPDRLKNTVFVGFHNGLMFSTRDRDNDRFGSKNCASDVHRGGWWYSFCAYINLNGDYEGDVTPTNTGILVMFIDTTNGGIASSTKAVKSTEMIIRTRVE